MDPFVVLLLVAAFFAAAVLLVRAEDARLARRQRVRVRDGLHRLGEPDGR